MKKSKLVLIAVTGIAILAAGIFFKQQFFLMFPLFVSLFVMAFQSEANKLGPLIGSINSLIYAAAYLYMGIYGSAASALLFSFPIQLTTFFRWKKNSYKKTAVFKRLSNKQRWIFGTLFLLLWAGLAVIFTFLDYEYAVLDSLAFISGFVVPLMTMAAYIEYTYLWIFQASAGLLLNIQMVTVDVRQTTYLIYGVYALYCVAGAFMSVRKFYKEQQCSETEENTVQ